MIRRLLFLTLLVCGVTTLWGDPTDLCAQYPSLACAVPNLVDNNCCGGNYLAGVADFDIDVNGAAVYTNSSGSSQGYIVLIHATPIAWNITPCNGCGSSNVGVCPYYTSYWSPATDYIYATQSYSVHGAYTSTFQAPCKF